MSILKKRHKVELPQNVQLFFSGLFVLSYVDWVLLHRKMLKTLYFKRVFTKFFVIFEKTDFLTFFKKSSKSCFWSILTSNSDRASKIRWGGCFWTYQNLFYGKYSKNKIFQFFPKKSYNSKKRTLQLFGTTFYFSPLHQWKNLAKIFWAKICFDMKKSNVFFSKKNVFLSI